MPNSPLRPCPSSNPESSFPSDKRDEKSYHKAAELEFRHFPGEDPLLCLQPQTREIRYVQNHLKGLDVSSVLVEPNYVDWDFLDQHTSFYSSSMLGIPNLCRRVHYFSGTAVTREQLRKALTGDLAALTNLQDHYQGFVVIRPIQNAPLGRTVLRWQEDHERETTPRVIPAARPYAVHIAGLTLTVTGLSWQQQDQATGTCAVIALWSAQQASPYRHFSSTTPEITLDAHRFYASGNRTFPSTGLSKANIVEAIRAIRGLDACVIEGNEEDFNGQNNYFSRFHFGYFSSMFTAGGFPVLLYGESPGSKQDHVNLMIGYRSVPSAIPQNDDERSRNLQEAWLQTVYVHDDCIGPNVRYDISIEGVPGGANGSIKGRVLLNYAGPGDPSPETREDDQGKGKEAHSDSHLQPFIPTCMIVLVPNAMRSNPMELLHRALLCNFALAVWDADNSGTSTGQEAPPLDFSFSLHIVSIVQYFEEKLKGALVSEPDLLANVRLDLLEKVPPMSRYIAVTRFSVRHPNKQDFGPFLDILYDTSGSVLAHPVLAVVMYQELAQQAVDFIQSQAADIMTLFHTTITKNKTFNLMRQCAGPEYILSPRTVFIPAILKKTYPPSA